jgi:hypothetical protein
MADLLKELLDELSRPQPKHERHRKNHSIYVDTHQFNTFRRVCNEQGRSASEVIDKLIAVYLKTVTQKQT